MKQGFTLAEVLITLGIVGVVAVLSIPSVMNNYHNRVYTAQLQKSYAQITSAVEMAMHDDRVDNFYESRAGMVQDSTDNNCKTGPCYFLGNYFGPVKKNCSNTAERCIVGTPNNPYRTLTGGNAGGIPNDYCVQTTNDAAICMKRETNYAYICVDVNGINRPNIAGRDMFCMDIKSNGLITDFGSKSPDPKVAGAQGKDCNTGFGGFQTAGCLSAVIDAGWKMEY